MSKRNFILLIIVLVIIIVAVFGFLYSMKDGGVPGEDSPGTNFISQFNPFGNNTNKPGDSTAPVDVSGYEPGDQEISPILVRVSSMPIAGFGVYIKERLKDMPLVETPTIEQSLGTPYDFGTSTIKNGSTGEGVMELQRFLNTTLEINLELSGTVDAETLSAIKTWQTGNALTSDGVVGSKTKSAMYASVNQNTNSSEPTPPPTEFVPALRYVDRATGNIYQTFADKIEERRFTDTVIPKVYEALFGSNGESVVMRYLKADGRTIQTFLSNLPKEYLGGDTTEANEAKGIFLPENIKDISLSADTESMLYLFISRDNMIATTHEFKTGKKVQLFDSPFTEWLSTWPNSKLTTFTTKPASGMPGYMYAMDPASKNLIQVLGKVNGLTTLASPSGNLVLYGDDSLSLSLYDTDARTVRSIGIRTLPEKCIWGTGSDFIYCAVPRTIAGTQYPDIWYQGEVSFSDQLWKIDVDTGNTTLVADPLTITGAEDIDAIKLALDSDEKYLFFVNKKDSFLWKLELK